MKENLTSRQWRLKDWLEANHISGVYHSIEEIVESVKYADGTNCYTLNTNPRVHAKCLALWKDIKEINWNIVKGFKIIIRNQKGGVKLCETPEEFGTWYDKEHEAVSKKAKYLNNLKAKARRHGVMFFINQANNVVDDPKPTKVFLND